MKGSKEISVEDGLKKGREGKRHRKITKTNTGQERAKRDRSRRGKWAQEGKKGREET